MNNVKSLNPYSNGSTTMGGYEKWVLRGRRFGLNPYSNGSTTMGGNKCHRTCPEISVLILILMEVPQWDIICQFVPANTPYVLILILMEVPQWGVTLEYYNHEKDEVLILILMEVPQWVVLILRIIRTASVLILILMEVPQWGY